MTKDSTVNYNHYHSISGGNDYSSAISACKSEIIKLMKYPGATYNDEWNRAIVHVVRAIEKLPLHTEAYSGTNDVE